MKPDLNSINGKGTDNMGVTPGHLEVAPGDRARIAGRSSAIPPSSGPLGGLMLSAVRASSPMLVVRAVRWWRDLARLGVRLPLFVVHDLGLLYAAPREQIELAPRPGAEAALARVPKLSEARGGVPGDGRRRSRRARRPDARGT